MDIYTEAQRDLQEQFDSRRLAERMSQAIITDRIDDTQRAFITNCDFFFLATVNGRGEPTVSYKGGGVGVVSVLDETTVAFPSYDGNGMFLSMGNVAEQASVGLLFIDFETPRRLRLQAQAELSTDPDLLSRYPGAQLVVKATVSSVFVNCARMVHKHTRTADSPYVPDDDGQALYPSWKRIDLMQDALPAADQGRAESEGGTISVEEYEKRLAAGES